MHAQLSIDKNMLCGSERVQPIRYVYRTKESVENVLIKSFKFLHKRGLTFQKSLYTLCVNSVEARSGVQFII